MPLTSLLQPRLCLLAAGALAVTAVLVMNHDIPKPADEGVVWVYATALCAAAGDASQCAEPTPASRRVFDTMEACASHRDEDLAQAANPRLLGICKRQREA